MPKIIANDRRTVTVTSNDLAIMRSSPLKLTEDQADACAVALAAMRHAALICGPGTKAVHAALRGVPLPMRVRVAHELRRAA